MSDQQRSETKILRAIAIFLIAAAFIPFRYPTMNALAVGGLLVLGGFACMIVAALNDENLRKIPIISVRGFDIILYILFYFLFTVALDQSGIKLNAKFCYVLMKNDVFFITYLLFIIASVVRTFL